MKDILRKPIFYFIAVPVVLSLWPLWLATVGTIGAKNRLYEEKQRFVESQEKIAEILQLDSKRLEYAETQNKAGSFDYATAINKVAQECGITPTGYNISVKPARNVSGQKVQEASLAVDNLDIVRFTTFLSLMQYRWPNLQCTQLKLEKKKGAKDSWKADMRLSYFM